jgi:1-acyl-sn-glycerol-3-phosphate acyltransferase
VAGKIVGCVKTGVGEVFNIVLLAWTVVSAVSYGFMTMLASALSRSLGRKVARLWCVHLLFLTRVKVVLRGASNIEPGKTYVFVANHQGYFDIPVLYSSLGSGLSFVAKKELFALPFFGWGMAAIGCISMDRKNPRNARSSISRAIAVLRKNHQSLVLFPEGTRSQTGRVGEFKRASFTLALEAGVPLVPVAICGTGAVHNRTSHRIRPGTVTVVVGTPILTEKMQKMTKEELSGTVREIIAKAMEKTCS